jgi:hypothetical protein
MIPTERENAGNGWKKAEPSIFWAEIAPCNHLVQIYDSDEVLFSTLLGFISNGFDIGESVIIIATASHIVELDKRLLGKGYDMEVLRKLDRYISLDADLALKKFMSNGWPDEAKFNEFVRSVVLRARGKENRQVRAFGEMVAILWAQGYSGATVHLEQLWNKFCQTEDFCLFCSYPRTGFTQDAKISINHICSTHTKIIEGNAVSAGELLYRDAT